MTRLQITQAQGLKVVAKKTMLSSDLRLGSFYFQLNRFQETSVLLMQPMFCFSFKLAWFEQKSGA